MNPDFLAGIVVGIIGGAFGVALIPCGHNQDEAERGEIVEGKFNKGGLNSKPKTPRPNLRPAPLRPNLQSRGAIEPHLPPKNPVPPSQRTPAAGMPRVAFYSEGEMILSRCAECKGVKEHAPECSDSGIYQELEADPDLIGRPI